MRIAHVEGRPACPFCDLNSLSPSQLQVAIILHSGRSLIQSCDNKAIKASGMFKAMPVFLGEAAGSKPSN